MAPPSGGGFFAGRHGVIAEPALPPRSRAGPLWRRRRSLPNSGGPSSNQRRGVAVSNLRCCTKAFLEPGTAPAPRCTRPGPRPTHMIDPMPTQGVVVDREFPSRSLDRCPGRQQPFNPHPFEVLASLTASGPGTLLTRHWLPPRLRPIKKKRSPVSALKAWSLKVWSPQKISQL